MAKYMLVSFKTCPWVQRSAIVLREKNTEFELRHIEPDNRPEWFLAISPHKKVPVLRIDDKVSLFESNAINDWGEIAGNGFPAGCTDFSCTHAYVLIPCGENHSDDEGCEDGGEANIASKPASVIQDQPGAGPGRVPTGEIAARIQGRRVRGRSFGALPPN